MSYLDHHKTDIFAEFVSFFVLFCTDYECTDCATWQWCTKENAHSVNDLGFYRCSCLEVNADVFPPDQCYGEGIKDLCNHSRSDFRHCLNSTDCLLCECHAGLKHVNGTCQDANKCDKVPYICREGIICNNSDRSCTCSCEAGYQLQNASCCNIDGCKRPSQSAHLQICTQQPDPLQCICHHGFILGVSYCQTSTVTVSTSLAFEQPGHEEDEDHSTASWVMVGVVAFILILPFLAFGLGLLSRRRNLAAEREPTHHEAASNNINTASQPKLKRIYNECRGN